MNPQHQILIHAALYSHGWPSGTDYCELASDAQDLFTTVQELAVIMTARAPTESEFLDFLGYEAEE